MIKLLINQNRKSYIAIALSIITFFCLLDGIYFKDVYASDYTYTESRILDANGDLIFEVSVRSDGTIYFYGRHKRSNSGVTYHTVSFNMNLDGSNSGQNYINGSIMYTNLTRIEDNDWGPKGDLNAGSNYDPDYIWDVYKLEGETVVNELIKLMKAKPNIYPTSKDIFNALSSGVTVKFSNEFEVIDRATRKRIGTSTYKTLAGIRKSVETLLGIKWSDTTYYDILPYYYDNILTIKLKPFNYKIRYVETKDFNKNKMDATILKQENGGTALYGEEIEYDLGDIHGIKIKNKTYSYNSAQYYYSNGLKNDETVPTYANGKIKTTHFRRDDGYLYILLDEGNPGQPTDVPTPVVPTPGDEGSTKSSIGVNYFDAKASGVINADNKGSEKFNVTQGIPTTENLYCFAIGSQYLINAKFNVVTGNKVYPVAVSKTYKVITPLEEPKEGEEPEEPTEEEVTVQQTVYISRDYQYTEIDSIDYYKINGATITNTALPGGSVSLTPSSYSVPSLTYTRYSEDEHIKKPDKVDQGITLPNETVEELPNVDFTSEVEGMIGQIKVKNDQMSFGGSTVLSNNVVEKTAPAANLSAITSPSVVSDYVLYNSGLRINDTLSNGTYPSDGTIKYERVVGYNSSRSSTLSYSVSGLNSVTVHTPVYCDGTLVNDNNQYVQLVNPDLSCVPLVLDEEGISSDFTVNISNTGTHNMYLGYMTKNYVMNTLNNSSYIATNSEGIPRNEVKFPFDVMIDVGNDNKSSNDTLLSKNTWYATGLVTNQRFYLPMYVECGTMENAHRE